MKKQLLILRHAKSDWDADYRRDFDRPLNKRGERDAKLVGQWMSTQQLRPGYVVSSPAVRAQRTWEQVAECLGLKVNMAECLESLYLADLGNLLSVIKSAPNDCQQMLLVGHNPGLEELVLHLSATPPPLTNSGKLFTTANLAIFEVSSDFAAIEPHHNHLEKLLRPVELR